MTCKFVCNLGTAQVGVCAAVSRAAWLRGGATLPCGSGRPISGCGVLFSTDAGRWKAGNALVTAARGVACGSVRTAPEYEARATGAPAFLLALGPKRAFPSSDEAVAPYLRPVSATE